MFGRVGLTRITLAGKDAKGSIASDADGLYCVRNKEKALIAGKRKIRLEQNERRSVKKTENYTCGEKRGFTQILHSIDDQNGACDGEESGVLMGHVIERK